MDTNKQVKIPDDAINAAAGEVEYYGVDKADRDTAAYAALHVAAPLIVAVELERLSNELEIDSQCYSGTAKQACADWSELLRHRVVDLRRQS